MGKNQLAYFRAKAKKSRKEIMAILMGTIVSADEVDIVYFDYPKIEFSTPSAISPDQADEADAVVMANEAGYSRLGTIHSHVGVPCYMSPTDKQSHLSDADIISGIVEVCGGKTRVAFWQADSSVPCDIKVHSVTK